MPGFQNKIISLINGLRKWLMLVSCKVLGDLAVSKSGEIDQARILYCTPGYYTRVWGFLYTGENNKISITYKECKVRQDVSA